MKAKHPGNTLLFLILLFHFCFHINLSGATFSTSDTSRINSLTKEAYRSARVNPDYSISVAHQALSESKSTDYLKGIADANLALGSAWLAKYNPADSAGYYYHRALDIYLQTSDIRGQARTYYGLSYLYNFKGQAQKALESGILSVEYFEQAGNLRETIAALGAVIYLDRRAGKHTEALDLATKAVELAQSLNDTLLWANALNDQGQVYKDMFLINQAIDSYFEAFSLWDLKADTAGLAIAYGSIANTYFYQEDYRKSLEYNFRKLPLTQEAKNLWETNKTINNISLAYSNLNIHDSALIYTRQSLQIAEKLNYPEAVANSCDMLASVFIKVGELDSALIYNTLAVTIAEKNHGQSLANYLNNLASVLKEQGKYQSALAKAQQAYDLAKSKNDTHTRRTSAFLLSGIYYQLNQAETASPYFNEYLKLNDSIKNMENMRKVTRLDIQHEYDKKQRAAEYEIELLDKTNQLKTQRLRKTWSWLIALLLLSISGAIISLLIIRNKNHRLDQMHLEIRNYLLQLDNLKTKPENEDPVESLVKNFGLTQREAEIMGLISTGIGNEDIAEKLFVSRNTIKFHIKNIFIKLDVRNRVQALHKIEG